MAGSFAVPFHFAVEFLVLVVAIGAVIDAARARRHGAGAWAIGQGLGFAALAVAQVLHGALVRAADGDPAVLILRTFAFGLLAMVARPAEHVSPTARPTAGAMATPALFLPGAAAQWAVAPAIAAFAVAARGIKAHRRDQDPATFAFAAAFISFGIAEAATALAPEGGGTALPFAHAARAAAALLLARWLWTAIVGSVRLRFVASIVVLLTVAILVVSAALNVVIGNTLQREELRRLASAGDARITKLQDLGEAGIVTADTFARAAGIQQVLDASDPRWREENDGPQGRVQTANTLAAGVLSIAPSNADLVLLVDRRGSTVGSAETTDQGTQPLPAVETVLLQGSAVVEEALAERPTTSAAATSSLDPSAEVEPQLVVLSASPSIDERRLLGAVVVGFRIDERFLREIALDTGAEATLIVGERATDTTFVAKDAVVRGVAAFADGIGSFERGTITTDLRVGEVAYPTVLLPARAADGQLIGFIALSQRSGAIEHAERDTTRTLFLIALFGMALGGGLAWISGGRVTRPIRSLTAAARELRQGNLQTRTKISSRDEVGTLGSAFNDMAEELQRKTGDLESAATTQATLRARMESILQSMGDALIATDRDGVVTTVNRAAEQLLRVRGDHVAGRPIGEVLSGTTGTGRRLSQVALTGKGADGMLHAGRTTIPVALTSAPLQDAGGEEVGRVVVVRDMSALQAAERMKSEFLSNVSHELRTPITPIKGYAEILKRKRFPRDKTEQFLDGVLESTERLERIVEILVDFASLEAGRLKPRSEPVPVVSLLDGVTHRWRQRNGAHRFVRRGGRGVPPILGDERLLDRSLHELLDNAVKFSPDGGTIEVAAQVQKNGRTRAGKVRITVRDRGIGIDPDQMPDLFQDFRQLDGSETRTYGGLGLGLAYVKRIMTAHRGSIEVESTPGEGSAFSLVLPAADARKGKTAARARSVRRVAASPKGTGRAKPRSTGRRTSVVKRATGKTRKKATKRSPKGRSSKTTARRKKR